MENDPLLEKSVERLRTVTLPPFLALLQIILNNIESIQSFRTIINIICNYNLTEFLKIQNKNNQINLDNEAKSIFVQLLVGSINNILPLNYIWIVVIAKIKKTKSMVMIPMKRKLIPGAHDLLHPNVIPTITLKESQEIEELINGTINPTDFQNTSETPF